MPDRVTLDVLDVLDGPADGVLAALRRARGVRASRPDGLRALLALGTAHFVPRVRPAPTPRRIALLAAWDGDEAVGDRWTRTLGELCDGASESWHVEAEIARASFSVPMKGWLPDVTGARPLASGEPALIIISGDLRARHVPVFLRDAAGAGGQAFAHPGYLGGLGVTSSPLNTTSVSCWRTYADARDYAFAAGDHADAMRRDRAGEHHKTEWFLRLRPLAERGSLDGSEPLQPVLAHAAAA